MNSDDYKEIYLFMKKYSDMLETTDVALEKIGITKETALKEADKFISDFSRLYYQCEIQGETSEQKLINICRKSKKVHNENTVRLCAYALTDSGLLFGDYVEQYDDDEKIILWIKQSKKYNELIEYIKQIPVFEQKLRKLSLAKNVYRVNPNLEEQASLYKMALQHEFLYKAGNHNNIFLANIGELVGLVNSDDELKRIKPFVYSTVLCRKHKLMLERNNFSPNFKSIFKYAEYKIYSDNGKNFNTYQSYIELYEQLKRSFYGDPNTDIAFSDYCFAALSNLSEWYYINCEPNESVPKNIPSTILDFAGDINLSEKETISMLKRNNIDDFVYDNPVINIAFENTINDKPEILWNFIEQKYNNTAVAETVNEFITYSQTDKMT